VLPYDLAMVDLADAGEAARFRALSPFGMMPVLEDAEKGAVVYESTIVLEHLAATRTSASWLLPPDRALEVRLWDRILDLHVHQHVQKVVFDRLRPGPEARDAFGVEQARARLREAYAVLEDRMADRTWVAGAFSMAECAAAPALHYAQKVEPFAAGHSALGAYLARLEARPAVARVLERAAPYAENFPQDP
jgi:glutathione S-transferase